MLQRSPNGLPDALFSPPNSEILSCVACFELAAGMQPLQLLDDAVSRSPAGGCSAEAIISVNVPNRVLIHEFSCL
ncbi:hypothetical protein [Egbenema bharatensis]|uniref:hypothetical protein n=1 Tax=Egbenema bharatensis TaxID=3463334 RepID=UPI003A839C92